MSSDVSYFSVNLLLGVDLIGDLDLDCLFINGSLLVTRYGSYLIYSTFALSFFLGGCNFSFTKLYPGY